MGLRLSEVLFILAVLVIFCLPVIGLTALVIWYLRRPKCPYCLGRVRTGATVCHHCRRSMTSSDAR
jgi:uncharacterized iron-regulated membrane protein